MVYFFNVFIYNVGFQCIVTNCNDWSLNMTSYLVASRNFAKLIQTLTCHSHDYVEFQSLNFFQLNLWIS
jgi:hypothetical protein